MQKDEKGKTIYVHDVECQKIILTYTNVQQSKQQRSSNNSVWKSRSLSITKDLQEWRKRLKY